MFTIGFFVSSHIRMCVISEFALSLFSSASTLFFRKGNRKPNFVSTASSFGENFAHNMWNHLFNEQTGVVFVLYVEEIDLANVALSSHFALDLLCFKEGAYDSV